MKGENMNGGLSKSKKNEDIALRQKTDLLDLIHQNGFYLLLWKV